MFIQIFTSSLRIKSITIETITHILQAKNYIHHINVKNNDWHEWCSICNILQLMAPTKDILYCQCYLGLTMINNELRDPPMGLQCISSYFAATIHLRVYSGCSWGHCVISVVPVGLIHIPKDYICLQTIHPSFIKIFWKTWPLILQDYSILNCSLMLLWPS